MLRRRSRQVAEHSQHMEGRAIDAHFVDVGTARIRDIAMRMQEGGVGFYPTGSTPWVHIDSGSVRYWPRMSRDLLARLFPDGKTVFIPSDGQPMPSYDQARAEIEQRGGQIQTAGGGGGLFAWLFGARGGGDDDAEEGGGQESMAGARGGRTAATTVQIADAGPDAVAKAKRNLPIGRIYASPPAAAPEPEPSVQIADAGPEAVATAKRNLPTGPTYASAPAPAPAIAPPPKPEVVAALEQQPDVETDASPEAAVKLHGPIAALYLAPLPPRRPIDLNVIALMNVPLPPVRPTDLIVAYAMPPVRPADIVAAAPDATASIEPRPPVRPASFVVALAQELGDPGVKTLAQPGGDDLIADVLKGRLPKVITRGVSTQPAKALALAEAPAAGADNEALLARAAEMTAPLPPMPVPNVRTHSPDQVCDGFGQRRHVAAVRRAAETTRSTRRSRLRRMLATCADLSSNPFEEQKTAQDHPRRKFSWYLRKARLNPCRSPRARRRPRRDRGRRSSRAPPARPY